MSKYIPTIAEQVIDMAYEKVDDLLMELFEQHKRVLEAGRLLLLQVTGAAQSL